MDEIIIDNLKQFIQATISQATAQLATKEELAGLATKEEFAQLATKEELAGLATKEEFAQLATKEELAGLATKEELRRLANSFELMQRTMDHRFDDLDLKLSTIADALSETLEDHEQRITRLEQHKIAA